MERRGKRERLLLFLLMIMLVLSAEKKDIFAKNSEVRIKIENSTKANLYYRILKNKKEISDDVSFKLLDEENKVIVQGKTQNAILYTENIPFGKYKIIFADEMGSTFTVVINSDYIKEQHIIKELELWEESIVKTGDALESRIIIHGSVIVLWLLGLSYYIRKAGKYE